MDGAFERPSGERCKHLKDRARRVRERKAIAKEELLQLAEGSALNPHPSKPLAGLREVDPTQRVFVVRKVFEDLSDGFGGELERGEEDREGGKEGRKEI